MPVYQTYIVDSVLLDIRAIIVKVLVGDFKEPVGAFFRHEGECSFNLLTSAATPAGAAVDAVGVLAGVGRQRSVHSLQIRVTRRRAFLQQFYFNFTFQIA